MQRSTGAKVAATSYSQNTSNQKLTIHPSTWIKTAFQTLSAPYGRSEKSCPGQPQNQSLSTTSTAVSTGSTTSPQKTLHFMACMQGGRYRRVVHQDPIDDIATDKELFLFLRQQVTKRRGHIRRAFSLKCIQGLYFVKVSLPDELTNQVFTANTSSSSVSGPLATQKSVSTSPAAPTSYPKHVSVYLQPTKSSPPKTQNTAARRPVHSTSDHLSSLNT